MSPAGSTGDWTAAWAGALHDLELELDRAEALLHSGLHSGLDLPLPAPWQPPALPPLPASLRERAQAVHERQLRVSAEMTRRMSDLARHQQVAERMSGRAPRRALYVDSRV